MTAEVSRALEEDSSQEISRLRNKLAEEQKANLALNEKIKRLSEEIKSLDQKLDKLCGENSSLAERHKRQLSLLVLKDISNEKLENDLRATEALLRDKDEEINKLSEQLVISQIETAAEIDKRDLQLQEMKARVSTLEVAVSDKANAANLTQPSTMWGAISDDVRQQEDSPVTLHYKQAAGYSIEIDRKCHYRGSLEAHPSNFQIQIPHKSHGGPTEDQAEKQDPSLASPVSKLADSEVFEKDIISELAQNPLKMPLILNHKQLEDKASQTLDIELTQMRRRSERVESLDLKHIIEYIQLSHEYRPTASFDCNLADPRGNTTPCDKREPARLQENFAKRISLKGAIPDPVNHDILVPGIRGASACKPPLVEVAPGVQMKQVEASGAGRKGAQSRRMDAAGVQQDASLAKVARSEAPALVESQDLQWPAPLSRDLQEKIKNQNDAIDSFFEQLVESSSEELASPTRPAMEGHPGRPRPLQTSVFRHTNSAPMDSKGERGSLESSLIVPCLSLDKFNDSTLIRISPQISRFELELKKLDSSGTCEKHRPVHRHPPAFADSRPEWSSSSRASSSRKKKELSGFNIRKATTQAEATILSSPAWK